MQRFAIIPAAGDFKRHEFDKPRGLLSLNGETVLERLVRQLGDIETLVGIGKPGILNWSADHVAELEKLPCRVIRTPFSTDRTPVRVIKMLLQTVLDDHDVEPSDWIYMIQGDAVFTDRLFEEMLTYSPPVIWVYKWGEPGMTLTGEVLNRVINTKHTSTRLTGFIGGDCKKVFPGRMVKKLEYCPRDFIEIDSPLNYQEGIQLVKRDQR